MKKDELYKRDEDLVYTPYIRHWKTKKIIRRPNGGVFVFPRKRK